MRQKPHRLHKCRTREENAPVTYVSCLGQSGCSAQWGWTITPTIYNEIAEGWYGLRHWTRFRAELDELAARWQGGSLLNIGCAHGPDFLPFKDGFELCGLDSSDRMIAFARKYARKHGIDPCLVVGDARRLPFHSSSFAHAIAIAAYHTIEGEQARADSYGELNRVLKPGGEAFLTVWNRWQPAFWRSGREVHVPWRTHGRVLERYYYLYRRGELTGELRAAGFEIVRVSAERSYRLPVSWFSRNICILVRKRPGA